MEIQSIADNFSISDLKHFFRERITSFKPEDDNLDYLFDEDEEAQQKFTDIAKAGEAELTNNEDLILITARCLDELTGKSGKKKQYDIAKKILKEEDKDTAFFIFYDDAGSFRFSFIRTNYIGSKRDFTSFKRYTFFVSPEQTNKTFVNRISKCDFTSADSIQEAFSVEPITKEFYEMLQHWYFWAIDSTQFPEHAEQEKNGREIAIIRMITRIMFIWFMKVRKLIPENIFDQEKLEEILKDLSPEESTYYKAILQNLFFATLNTKHSDRRFRSEERNRQGYNPDFGNHNVFRHHELFYDPEAIFKLFEKIPFLNGGLFECLDIKKVENREDRKYIDGFTSIKSQQPKVPNDLFFSEAKKKDISRFYGESNKQYPVEGLIHLLKRFNFTIDENEPDDIEVALDPELLGSIFENLLASYNPETATTARKSTGSYYTPREIVNYMVEESLIAYLKTHLENQNVANVARSIPASANNVPEDIPASGNVPEGILASANVLAGIPASGNVPEGIPASENVPAGILASGNNVPEGILASGNNVPDGIPASGNNVPDGIPASGNNPDKPPFLDPSEEINIHEGDLPHWKQENVFYFVTFRLADSIPKEKREQLKRDRENWEKVVAGKDKKDYTKEDWIQYNRLFSERVENWMNAGYGKCLLKKKENAKIVADAIKYFEGERYELDEWVIMPNHVHVLVRPFNGYKLSDILHSWKSYSANEINKREGLKGEFWMRESYDHIVRNEDAFKAIRNYIRKNPEKAGIKVHFQNNVASNVARSIPASANVPEGIPASGRNQSKDTLETLLRRLISHEDDNPFDENTTKALIQLIDNIRVVDPAVGSGAFPMAVLNKLVFILNKIDKNNKLWEQIQIDGIYKYVKDPVAQRNAIEQVKKQFAKTNNDYGRKLYLIEKCIYGVDIQQIAVEIAKLRFFISLLVDEDIDFENKENNFGIQPLPNLEFKLMQGNSLISSYAGIDFDAKEDTEKGKLFRSDEEYRQLITDFEELKHKYQNEPDNEEKGKLRKQIENTILNIFNEKLNTHFPEMRKIEDFAERIPGKEARENYLRAEKAKLTKKLGFDIEQLKKDLVAYTHGRKDKDFFLWTVYFAEVFSDKNGFDVVIGNPPYIKEYTNKAAFNGLRNQECYQGKMDIWYLFGAKGIDLLRDRTGVISYIATNNWITNKGGLKFRNKILNEAKIHEFIDFGDFKVFKNVGIQTMVFIAQKTKNNAEYNASFSKILDPKFPRIELERFLNKEDDHNFVHFKSLMIKTQLLNNPLLFLTETIAKTLLKLINKNYLLLQDYEVAQGVVFPQDFLNRKNKQKLGNDYEVGEGIFLLTTGELNNLNLSQNEVKIIKPFYTSKQLKKYWGSAENDLWVIYTDSSFKNQNKASNYPRIKEHLDRFKDIITSDNKPYGLHRAREESFFKGEKIISLRKCSDPTFTYTDFDCYVSQTFFVIKTKRINQKYLTAILNSKLIAFWLKYKGKMQGNNYQVDKEPILNIPIKETHHKDPFINILNQILSKKESGEDTTREEQQIDIMVYKLYNLTYDEVKIVDPDFVLSEAEYEQFAVE